jgi:hypothetical protein
MNDSIRYLLIIVVMSQVAERGGDGPPHPRPDFSISNWSVDGQVKMDAYAISWSRIKMPISTSYQ